MNPYMGRLYASLIFLNPMFTKAAVAFCSSLFSYPAMAQAVSQSQALPVPLSNIELLMQGGGFGIACFLVYRMSVMQDATARELASKMDEVIKALTDLRLEMTRNRHGREHHED